MTPDKDYARDFISPVGNMTRAAVRISLKKGDLQCIVYDCHGSIRLHDNFEDYPLFVEKLTNLRDKIEEAIPQIIADGEKYTQEQADKRKAAAEAKKAKAKTTTKKPTKTQVRMS